MCYAAHTKWNHFTEKYIVNEPCEFELLANEFHQRKKNHFRKSIHTNTYIHKINGKVIKISSQTRARTNGKCLDDCQNASSTTARANTLDDYRIVESQHGVSLCCCCFFFFLLSFFFHHTKHDRETREKLWTRIDHYCYSRKSVARNCVTKPNCNWNVGTFPVCVVLGRQEKKKKQYGKNNNNTSHRRTSNRKKMFSIRLNGIAREISISCTPCISINF